MDLFSFFKDNKQKNNERMSYAKTMQGNTPSYSYFGENVMNDETVFSITQRIIDEYSKLSPKHIRTVDGKQVKVADNRINELLKFPNDNESIADFLSKAAYMYLSYDNVYIYPMYDLYKNEVTGQFRKVYTQLKILKPSNVDFYEDKSGAIFVEFTFSNGAKSGLLEYNNIIHWRNHYGNDDFAGGYKGMPNNAALLKHLKLNDQLLQSTIKTINGSLTINGILKYPGLIKRDDLEKSRLEFENKLKNNESGIISLDGGVDYQNIDFKGQLINKETLDFLDKKTRRHFGVSEAILDGDYKPEQKEAFYESVLEKGIISLGYAFERVMLTKFERANGNEIVFYSNKIQMMSHDKKISLANLLMPVGGVTPNIVLSWFGQAPYEGGDNRYRSLNWIKEDIADQYQLKNTLNKVLSEEKDDENMNNKNNKDSYNNNDDKKDNDNVYINEGENNEE